jgi:hypothetical protein
LTPVVASGCLALGLLLSSGLPARQSGEVRALAVQYADGRRTVTALSTSGRVSWTPLFPRIDGAVTDRDGLPLRALQFEEAPDEDGVTVTVALLYGAPHQQRVQVTAARVVDERPVRVAELAAFGVRPVTFSLVPLPPAQLHLPSVISPSSSLDVSVETVTDPAPAYHATIVNHGSRDVMMLAFKTYRGNVVAMSGMPRGSGHTALIVPGDAYVLKLNATARAGRGATATGWLPIDRLEITSVLWSDDLVEGDGQPAAEEHAVDAGTALQLDRLLALLRAAARDPATSLPAHLRAGIDGLSIAVSADEAAAAAAAIPGTVLLPVARVASMMQLGMNNAKQAVLNDLGELQRISPSPAASDYAAWVTRTVAKYAAWRGRITR